MPQLAIASPLGPLVLTAVGQTLATVGWGEPTGPVDATDPVLREAARQIEAYFAGRLTAFTIPLAPAATPFQERVRGAMNAIAFGETVSYGAMARQLASAPRAVGGACGRNPLPIVVPCHRVVGGDGGATGYSGLGGTVTKGWLLAHERAYCPACV
jgi:methylated-DNA-[protein]-cysteine S-methyltransferase